MVDSEGRIIAFGVGAPQGETEESWNAIMTEFILVCNNAAAKMSFNKKDRRGTRSAATGISYGGGQTVSAYDECMGWLTHIANTATRTSLPFEAEHAGHRNVVARTGGDSSR